MGGGSLRLYSSYLTVNINQRGVRTPSASSLFLALQNRRRALIKVATRPA